MFSMVAIESGSVWNSGIVHSLWNILIIGGGLSISEKADEYSVMTLNEKLTSTFSLFCSTLGTGGGS